LGQRKIRLSISLREGQQKDELAKEILYCRATQMHA